MDINKVTLIGRLTQNPNGKVAASGQHRASFTVATNYTWKDGKSKERKETTEFHRVVVWGKLADIAATYLAKGSRLYVEGRLVRRAVIGRNGADRETTEVVADEIIMLGSAKRKSAPERGAADPKPIGSER